MPNGLAGASGRSGPASTSSERHCVGGGRGDRAAQIELRGVVAGGERAGEQRRLSALRLADGEPSSC